MILRQYLTDEIIGQAITWILDSYVPYEIFEIIINIKIIGS